MDRWIYCKGGLYHKREDNLAYSRLDKSNTGWLTEIMLLTQLCMLFDVLFCNYVWYFDPVNKLYACITTTFILLPD